MNVLVALLRQVVVLTNDEIGKRDAEIEKLKTALNGAQEENRKLWELIEKHRDVIFEELL